MSAESKHGKRVVSTAKTGGRVPSFPVGWVPTSSRQIDKSKWQADPDATPGPF